ncbi:hypothetical protein X798_00746 [Onchocerca flexuosa]|uniref:BZIP domain-containing protein n=1 Tax=Onchocerca flexuosa TaxID=387005 RepID=A0A238C4Z2_9BILA|nr:hypothetical protein X798_00746 [Onchocerca flexuosa]
MMNEQFCMVPFWGIPSPEANNLLSDCFIDCDDNNAAKTSARYSNSDSRLSTGYLLSEGHDDVPEWTYASKAMRNDEGRSSCSLESDSGSSCCGDNDISWLNEFMNIYGITTLDSNDDFNMKSTDITVVTSQAKENHPAVVLTPMEEMKSSEVLNDKFALQFSMVSKDVWVTSHNICSTSADPNISSAPKTNITQKTDGTTMTIHSSAMKALHSDLHQKSGIVPPSHEGEKFVIKRTCFGGISERKREQNRCAAIRYRGKRREEAKQKKQEQHELELRNVELKAEMNWLEKEVMYLKSLMKLTNSS